MKKTKREGGEFKLYAGKFLVRDAEKRKMNEWIHKRVPVPLTKEQEEEVESWCDFYSKREKNRKPKVEVVRSLGKLFEE